MLKKLRLKIILAIVLVAAVMLGAILGLFYTLTKQNLRTQSISMMQAIAADPFAMSSRSANRSRCACRISCCRPTRSAIWSPSAQAITI